MLKSLRGRLFVGLTAIIVLTGAIGGTFAYRWAYNEAIEMQDSVLIQIGTFALNAPVRQSQPVNGVDAEAEVGIVELGATPRGLADERRLWGQPDGLHNDVYQGQPVRVLLRTRSDGSRFAVTQRTAIRSEIAGDMALRTLLPIAALVPCLMLVTALVIARSFRPMVRLANELDARKGDDVGELAGTGAPGELQPFLGSINGLLRRMRIMMDQQRQFIADAAHELRTPITALSLQAENLDPLEMSPAARERLDALKSGMRRTKRLLEQLLALARHDAGQTVIRETVFLDAIARGVVADVLPEAAAREIDLGFGITEQVALKGEPFSLFSAVRNLVENAVKFTPNGGKVDLAVYREGDMAVLRIEDTGPGIPPGELARIFEPFFRGQQPAGEGSGLGLSIVKRIIDRFDGSIIIENIADVGRAGLRVTVRIPCDPWCADQSAARRMPFGSDMMSGATLKVDTDGRILAWSRDAEALFGYSAPEAVGQSVEIIIPPHLRGRHNAGFRRFTQTGISALPEIATTTALHKNGATLRLGVSVKAVYGEQQNIVAVEATFYRPEANVASARS